MFFRTKNLNMFREIRDDSDPFSLSNTAFVKAFRLDKGSTKDLIAEMLAANPNVREQNVSGIPFELRVLAVLHFFRHGNYQSPNGMNRFFPCLNRPCHGHSKSSRTSCTNWPESTIYSFPNLIRRNCCNENRIYDKTAYAWHNWRD